jgi:hypothetical protein
MENEANKSQQLKSDMKKATAFVKKLRAINAEGTLILASNSTICELFAIWCIRLGLQQCLRDADAVNLTLYISEIVGGILETSFKATDVPGIVQLCVVMHKRYVE